MTTPRISLAEPPYTAPIQAALDRLMPPGVPPLALFRALAVNERVFLRMMAGGLLDRGSITLRERELMIDRTCWRCGAEAEWGVHVTWFGPKAALTADEVTALCRPHQVLFGSRHRRDDTAAPGVSPRRPTSPRPRASA